jgi:integration host factor subunit beta
MEEDKKNPNVTKKQIIHEVAVKMNHHDIPLIQTVIQTFLDLMVDKLAKKERMEFRDFGVFEVVKRKHKKGRKNFASGGSGETVLIPGRYVVKFSPGKELSEKVKSIPVDSE